MWDGTSIDLYAIRLVYLSAPGHARWNAATRAVALYGRAGHLSTRREHREAGSRTIDCKVVNMMPPNRLYASSTQIFNIRHRPYD